MIIMSNRLTLNLNFGRSEKFTGHSNFAIKQLMFCDGI